MAAEGAALETGSCSVETPCVVVLADDQPDSWDEFRAVTVAGLSVLVFCALAALVGSWRIGRAG